MSSFDVKTVAQNALIACTYAVLTLAIAPLAYSEIQFRLSEIIVFLAFYKRQWIPGLVAGCFLANLYSPLGAYDLIFGTLSTLLVCYAMKHLNNRYVAAITGSIITGGLIGIELALAFGTPLLLNVVYVAIGELGVLVLGAIIFGSIEKKEAFKRLLQ